MRRSERNADCFERNGPQVVGFGEIRLGRGNGKQSCRESAPPVRLVMFSEGPGQVTNFGNVCTDLFDRRPLTGARTGVNTQRDFDPMSLRVQRLQSNKPREMPSPYEPSLSPPILHQERCPRWQLVNSNGCQSYEQCVYEAPLAEEPRDR